MPLEVMFRRFLVQSRRPGQGEWETESCFVCDDGVAHDSAPSQAVLDNVSRIRATGLEVRVVAKTYTHEVLGC